MRMRTLTITGFALCLALSALIPTATKSKTTSVEQHPLVGTWLVTVKLGFGGSNSAFFTFHSDSTALAVDSQGQAWPGVWIATGPRSGQYEFAGPKVDASIPAGSTFYGTAEVDATGNAFIRSSEIHNGDDIKGERVRITQ